MSIKQFFAKRLAKQAVNSTKKWAQNPIATQEKVLKGLLQKAKSNFIIGCLHFYLFSLLFLF
mgnify:CR=1 FL=1